ncbi:PTS system mannose/fructose/sorbose family transporter subunit IID [Vagococcus humatus]
MRRLKLMSKQTLTKSDIKKVYVRNLFSLQWGWNYEKMQGLGYCYVIMPALKKLYGDKPEEMKVALQTQLGFFNTTPAMSHLIIGADMALEEEFGMEDPSAITGLKTGLMGPFAGVGDTVFIAIYRAIVFSIAAYMAQGGQAIGLLIPILAGFAVMWVRYKFTFLGYNQGRRLAVEFADKMKMLTEAAAILGLTVVGGLIPSVITYKVDLTYKMGKVTLSMQEMLDKILPGLVPLAIVMLSYWLLGKKKMNSNKLIFVLILLGMLLGNMQSILGWIGQLF